MSKSKMRIGYIAKYGKDHDVRFKYREESYQRKITSRGDKVYSKLLLFPIDYEDIQGTTEIIKEEGLIVVCEPFFVDDELREKVTKWVEWANNADPKEYDLLYDLKENKE